MTHTTVRPEAPHVRAAAELAAGAVAAVGPDRWSAPSPCTEYDVRAAVEHLAWAALLSQRAATGTPFEHDWSTAEPPPFLAGREPGEWAGIIAGELRAAADAWADPAAWEGETVMGTTPMDAAVVGTMMLAEFALHGWDVARGAGAAYPVPEELGAVVLAAVEGMAAMGREGGWYGPEVDVPEDAPAFDQALGLSGRDPGWAPPD